MSNTNTNSYENLVKCTSTSFTDTHRNLNYLWQCIGTKAHASYDEAYEHKKCLTKLMCVMHDKEKLLKFTEKKAFITCPSDVIHEVLQYLKNTS